MSRGTIQADKIYVRGTCEICNEADVLIYDEGGKLRCAEDTRKWIRANPRKQTCDKCGSDFGVVRDPSHRRNEYLCLVCHLENGLQIKDSVTMRAMRAASQPNLPNKE